MNIAIGFLAIGFLAFAFAMAIGAMLCVMVMGAERIARAARASFVLNGHTVAYVDGHGRISRSTDHADGSRDAGTD